MTTDSSQSRRTCRVDSDGAVNLNDILNSFKAPMKEEHTWAICYQCVRFFIDARTVCPNNEPHYLVRTMSEVYLRTDGNIHPKTAHAARDADTKRRRAATHEIETIVGLGTVLYSTLDHCYNEEEERIISEPLDELMSDMISDQVNQSGSRSIHETDDEGIERDSEDTDMSSSLSKEVGAIGTQFTLKEVLQRCEAHVSILTKAQAECHYKAVVRALVTEALELSTFLDTVAKGIHLAGTEKCTTRDLDQLQFMDWSSLWLTVISELRMGVKLKKVNYGRAPIEYELTPYEILMKDIRSYRHNLRKVKTENVRRHARDIILNFIRSRPTLKKVSERKLAPRPPKYYSPREQLMHSIQKGRTLRKTHQQQQQQLFYQLPSGNHLLPPNTDCPMDNRTNAIASSVPNQERRLNMTDRIDGVGGDERGSGTVAKQRLISIDYSQLECYDDDYDDNDDDDEEEQMNLWTDEVVSDDGIQSTIAGRSIVDKYDLAMASYGPNFRFKPRSTENGTLHVIDAPMGTHSLPQSRPHSRQSFGSCATATDTTATTNSGPLDQLSLDNRLSLTLEEIVHIRTVLTRAEIEALPMEAQVRANVESRKICFLCLKTKFSVFGPWGHRCILCQCTVCTKCSGRMRVPMEHFASVPVVLLSPNIMATPDHDSLSDDFFPHANSNSGRSTPDGAGACASSAVTNKSPSRSRPGSSLDRFRNKTSSGVVDRLRGEACGQLMIVCHDCRAMVLQIIKSAQANRSAIRNKHLQSLTLDLSPMF